MSQTAMPGPCYYIFLGPVFFTSPQWNFCALLQAEVFVTEWGDLLGLSHTESASVLGVTEVKPPKWMAHKQHVELQSMHISIASDFLGAPVLYRGLQCRSLLSNPNAQLKIQLLGSTKNMYGEDCLHDCRFQTLLPVSGWLTVCLPESRVSCWLVQVPLSAQLATGLCLLTGSGDISPCFEQGKHGLVSLQERPQPYWLYAITWVTSE